MYFLKSIHIMRSVRQNKFVLIFSDVLGRHLNPGCGGSGAASASLSSTICAGTVYHRLRYWDREILFVFDHSTNDFSSFTGISKRCSPKCVFMDLHMHCYKFESTVNQFKLQSVLYLKADWPHLTVIIFTVVNFNHFS